jgi:hypothetical protein
MARERRDLHLERVDPRPEIARSELRRRERNRGVLRKRCRWLCGAQRLERADRNLQALDFGLEALNPCADGIAALRRLRDTGSRRHSNEQKRSREGASWTQLLAPCRNGE